MSDIVVTMNKKVDRKLVNDSVTISFVNNYAPEADETTEVTYADLSADEKEGLHRVLDFLTYEIEPGAIIWNIIRGGKTFDLGESTVRDEKNTTALPELTGGESLVVLFEVPGFEVNDSRVVNLFYDDDFNSTELESLEEIGIEITGNGKNFTITNVVECKVSFMKPELVTDLYIINDLGANNVIPV
jgi:hypothetical protein